MDIKFIIMALISFAGSFAVVKYKGDILTEKQKEIEQKQSKIETKQAVMEREIQFIQQNQAEMSRKLDLILTKLESLSNKMAGLNCSRSNQKGSESC